MMNEDIQQVVNAAWCMGKHDATVGKTLYLSGPMTGKPEWGFPEFDRVRDLLLDAGYDVISPADIDRIRGFDGKTANNPFTYEDCMAYDYYAIDICNGVALLNGWFESKGVQKEYGHAVEKQKEVHFWTEWINMAEDKQDLHVKGAKDDTCKVRMDLLLYGFPRALEQVAKIATLGAVKYTDNGWVDVPDGFKRYTGAMGRHIVKEAMADPEDKDGWLPHFGDSPTRLHAAQVAWNALARLELMERGL